MQMSGLGLQTANNRIKIRIFEFQFLNPAEGIFLYKIIPPISLYQLNSI